MNRTYIKEITKFLKTAYKSCSTGFTGCWHHKLDDKLYVVAAQGEEGEVVAKIAYNCDDLQCDYDLDWYEPTYTDGECAFTELSLSKGKFRSDAEWFYGNYKAMLREIKKGNLLCGD